MKYIDLGLPSGTLWAVENEEGLYNYKDAVAKYGDSLPTREQWEELMNQCKWKWNGSGYEVTGPNGKSIVLPAMGIRYDDGYVDDVGSIGNYRSSTPNGSDYGWCINFNSRNMYLNFYVRYYGESVRLVK